MLGFAVRLRRVGLEQTFGRSIAVRRLVCLSTLYPTATRSTGVGWALGVGRFGSVFAPLMVSALLAAQWLIAHVFHAAMLPTLLAALALYAAGVMHRKNMLAVQPH